MKSNMELGFWQGLYNEGNLLAVRERDYHDNFGHFPSWKKQRGKGIEVGSGLLSMLEFSDKEAVSIDPLMDEYDKIYKHNGKIETFNMDGESLTFKNSTFNFAVNINTIDHTPNPEKMISEIYRTLRKGGKLYFEVHFDKSLGGPHYILWNKEIVDKYLKKFKLLTSKIVRVSSEQEKYYAEYKK